MECVQFRMSGKFVATVLLSPGPRQKWKSVHVLLYPFVRELLELMNGFRVYDGHFNKHHEQMYVYLSVVHCDTVARNDLGCFAPVSARRNDARSLWEGTSGITGHGMYSNGYLEPVSQTWMGDEELVYANDVRAMSRLGLREGASCKNFSDCVDHSQEIENFRVKKTDGQMSLFYAIFTIYRLVWRIN